MIFGFPGLPVRRTNERRVHLEYIVISYVYMQTITVNRSMHTKCETYEVVGRSYSQMKQNLGLGESQSNN